jgi:Glycosyl hydrolases family 16
MADSPASEAAAVLDRTGYALEVEDTFQGPGLNERLWVPWYLPQWSSRRASAARYTVGEGGLRLRIDADQPAWNADVDGQIRVSSLQTGVFAGPVGSPVGQHRFRADLVVREAQDNVRLYAPRHGLFELRARALDDPACMVALWMIGYEDAPERSAEICVCEIFGRDVRPASASIGVGVHPFGDPAIRDDFSRVSVPLDVREVHSYAAEWTGERVGFYVDERLVKVVPQSPDYSMQIMLSLYEFREPGDGTDTARYPKVFGVEAFRGYRSLGT